MIARIANGPKNQGSAKSTLPFRMSRQYRTPRAGIGIA